MFEPSPDEIASRRTRSRGRTQLGLGLMLLGMTPLVPVVFAGLAVSGIPLLVLAMAVCVGLGSWQSSTAVDRLKLATRELKLLEGPSPAELPAARVVHTDHSR